MATKKEGVSCYDKSAPDEPLFVLCARDPVAPYAVEEWARKAQEAGVRQEKIDEAKAVAQQMRKYPTKKIPD
jgi:hypothetical protein